MNIILAIAVFGGLNDAPLFGAGIEVFFIALVFIFVVLVPALGKILSAFKGPPPPRNPGQPPRPARPASSSVQNEIEDFLRRANQKKGTPAARPQRPQSARPKTVEKPIRAEVVRERPVGGEVEQHVKKYLNQDEFARRSKKLGEEVAESDDKIERHLKSVFSHPVSKIAATPGVTAAPTAVKLSDTAPETAASTTTSTAGDVSTLFRDPANIRQAIILSEILSRPLDRWEREGRPA